MRIVKVITYVEYELIGTTTHVPKTWLDQLHANSPNTILMSHTNQMKTVSSRLLYFSSRSETIVSCRA